MRTATNSSTTSSSPPRPAASRSTLLGEPVGKQDQYIAAVGGITGFEFHADERVEIVPVEVTLNTRHRLEDNMLVIATRR